MGRHKSRMSLNNAPDGAVLPLTTKGSAHDQADDEARDVDPRHRLPPGSLAAPRRAADGTLRFEHYLHNAQTAERGKCDMIFFADGIGIRERDAPRGSLARSGYEIVEMEPMTLLPALAARTERIGLVTTASTTYNEPFHIARKFATLDLISNGRAGWNIVTSWSEAEAKNFDREEHLDYDTRYERAPEFVEVVTGLWDSWEDDAFIYDRVKGSFSTKARCTL